MLIIIISFLNIFSNIKNAKIEAGKKSQVEVIVIKNKIDLLFDICSAEYSYEEIITNKKSSMFGLSQKNIIIEAKGKIKAGCKIDSINKNGDKYLVTLKAPTIIDSNVEIVSEKSQTKFMGNFDISEDKELASKKHKDIESRVKEELFSNAKSNSKIVIIELLNQFGIGSDLIQIDYT